MKSSFIATAVLALAALGSVNTFAATQQNGEAAAAAISFTPSTSLVTRAEVQADFLSARKAGTLSVSNEGAFAAVAQAGSTVSREQVRIEAVMAAHGAVDHAL